MSTQALLSRVEDAGLNASAPPQQRWLDGWLVRFSPGKAKRARCVNAVAPGRLSLEEKLSLVEPVFRDAGLPLVVRITPFSHPEGLDKTLEAFLELVEAATHYPCMKRAWVEFLGEPVGAGLDRVDETTVA